MLSVTKMYYLSRDITEDFERLDGNGLFDSKEYAVKYLYHYLTQDWAETGDFCVLEIYR